MQLGIGTGSGIRTGTDITNADISSSVRPMDTKLSRMMTKDKGTPPTKSRDTSKIFYLHFHKAQGAQTQRDGD